MPTQPTLRRAAPTDLPRIVDLLQQAKLPASDLTATALADFTVAQAGAAVVGAVGLERHGSHALLRSLVVAPDWQGRGLGEALVLAAEARARATGIASLTLLTETAARFFAERGYVEIERSGAPAAVRASQEFTALCPTSSCCFNKSLDH